MKAIKRIKNILKTLLCFALVFMLIGNVPAFAQTVEEISTIFTKMFAFPLEISVNNATESDEVSVPESSKPSFCSLTATLREEFSEYEEVYLHIMHWESSNTLLSKIVSSASSINIENIETNKKYPFELKIYSTEIVRYYNGTLEIIPQKDGLSVSIKHAEGPEARNYKYVIQSQTLSDEEYESIYNQLDIPSYIAFETAKVHKHIRQMEEFRQSLTEIGFYNYDGTCTVYSFPSPVKYYDSNGAIHDFSAEFITTTQNEQQDGYTFKNIYDELVTYYSNKNDNRKNLKITTETDQIEYGFIIQSSNESSNLLGTLTEWFSSFDNAKIIEKYNEQRIEYTTKGCSLSHSPSAKGIKSTILHELDSRTNKIQIWVNKGTLKPIIGDNGKNIFFVNDNNQIIYSLGDIELSADISGKTTFSTQNSLEIVGHSESQFLLEITLDENVFFHPLRTSACTTSIYMSSETLNNAVVYAVPQNATAYSTEPDPLPETDAYSINLASDIFDDITTYYTVKCYYQYPEITGSWNFSDCTVFTNSTSDPALSSHLYVGKTATAYDSVSCTTVVSNEAIAFVRFSLPTTSVVTSENLSLAQLLLYCESSEKTNLKIQRIAQPWSDSSVTSSALNSIDTTYLGNTTHQFTGFIGYKHFNITRLVRDNLTYTENNNSGTWSYGVAIQNAYKFNPKLTFISSDHSDYSKLPRLKLLVSTDFLL